MAAAQATPEAAPATEGSAAAQPTESMEQATTTDQDMVDLQARSHFRLGREYYELGRFAEAAQEFEIAHGLSGRGSLLFNVYLAHRDAQNTEKAAEALRGYLVAVPDAPDREHLTARLAALEAQVAQARAAEQQARAAEQQQQAETAEAERQRQAAEARARAAERAAQQRPTRPWWPWLVVGAGALSAGAGVALGALASSDADALRDECVADPTDAGASAPLVPGNACAPTIDVASRRDSIQTKALIGDALWIGGAVVGVTGLILALALPDEYPEAPASVSAGCGPDQCHANLKVQF